MNGRTDNGSPAPTTASLARRGELIVLAVAAVDAFVLPPGARVGSANPSPGDTLRACLGPYSAGTVEWEVGPRGRSATVGLAVSLTDGVQHRMAIVTAIRVSGASTPADARQVAALVTAVAALAECLEQL